MWTAKLIKKNITDGVLGVEVEFTNGTEAAVEYCRPQDEQGLVFWVKSRLATFNGGEAIKTKYIDGETIDVSTPVVTPPTLTQAEIDANTWLTDYSRWIKVKSTLIDTGVLTGNETQVVALKTKVQNGFKPAYLNLI